MELQLLEYIISFQMKKVQTYKMLQKKKKKIILKERLADIRKSANECENDIEEYRKKEQQFKKDKKQKILENTKGRSTTPALK